MSGPGESSLSLLRENSGLRVLDPCGLVGVSQSLASKGVRTFVSRTLQPLITAF